jgi:hypothetical protein
MKALIIILGVLVVILGLLPLIVDFLPDFLLVLPSEGVTYNLLIALTGGLIIYLGYEKKVQNK